MFMNDNERYNSGRMGVVRNDSVFSINYDSVTYNGICKI